MTQGTPIKRGISAGHWVAGISALGLLVVAGLFLSYAQVRSGEYQAENLPRTTGLIAFNLRAAFYREVCSKVGQPGALVFGPYDWYEPGDYQVSFYLHYKAAPGTVIGRVEVSDARTTAILVSQDIISGGAPEARFTSQLAFSIGQSTMLEFRVWYYGIDRLCVDQVITQLIADH